LELNAPLAFSPWAKRKRESDITRITFILQDNGNNKHKPDRSAMAEISAARVANAAASGQKAPERQESHLFKEVNNLRKGVPEKDQDAIDRAKLNNTIFGKIAASKRFEYTTLAIIMLNAGFIGYDADFSARTHKPDDLYDSPAQFIIFENFFAIYFTLEVIIRFFAYKRKLDSVTDMWFVFDSTLVLFMVVETWILPILGASGPLSQLSVLRLLRLLRITRMAKLMRFFPELQIIVRGMVAAVRSVVCAGILQVLVLYVFAILFTSEYHQGDRSDEDVEGTAEGLFGSMGKSARHLFIMGTILDDITLCCNYIRGSSKGTAMMLAFVIFVLISSFTMLNMLIGILCEVVCATGEGERNKNTETNVREAIQSLFQKMDKDNNGEISRDEFLSMKHDKNVMKALQALEVKPKHFEMYADLMFKHEDKDGETPKIDYAKTVDMIMRLRPGTQVTALDFSSFQMTVFKNHDRLVKHIKTIEKFASSLTGLEPLASLGGCSTPPSLDPNKQYPMDELPAGLLPRLKQSSDEELLNELQQRLGIDGASLPAAPASPSKIVDTIQTHPLGAPDTQSPSWSNETYTC